MIPLSEKEYQTLLNLYHDFQEAFKYLPEHLKQAFFAKLLG